MNKQEAIDVIEAYRRNMEHILGAEHETVKAISTCEMLVGELEDQTAQRWIPVSERLPNESEYYLVSDGSKTVYYAYFDGRSKTFPLIHNTVKAWMPLPEPYKETKE